MYCPLCGKKQKQEHSGACEKCGLGLAPVKQFVDDNRVFAEQWAEAERKSRNDLITRGIVAGLMALPIGMGVFADAKSQKLAVRGPADASKRT